MTYAPLVAWPFEVRVRDDVDASWWQASRHGTLAEAETARAARLERFVDVRLTDEALRYVATRTGQTATRAGGGRLRIGDGPPIAWETAEIHAEGCTPTRSRAVP